MLHPHFPQISLPQNQVPQISRGFDSRACWSSGLQGPRGHPWNDPAGSTVSLAARLSIWCEPVCWFCYIFLHIKLTANSTCHLFQGLFLQPEIHDSLHTSDLPVCIPGAVGKNPQQWARRGMTLDHRDKYESLQSRMEFIVQSIPSGND